MPLILQDFAGQYCMTVLLVENLDTLRLILSQIFTTIFKKTQILQQSQLHHGCHLLAHSLGNGSELPTHWYPSCSWH